MSAWATTWAYEQDLKTCGKKAILVALAHFADEEGFCYPGQETLAGMTSQGVSTVRAHIESLEADGLITRDKRYKKGKRTSDGFHLQAPIERLKPPQTYRRKLAVVQKDLPPEKLPTTAEKPAPLPPDSAHDLSVDLSVNDQTNPRAHANGNSKPRKPGSFDERNDKSPKFGIELIRVLPEEWLDEQRTALRKKFPSLDFDHFHEKWCQYRFRDGGIGKRHSHIATLLQYAADLEIFFDNCFENQQRRNGNNGKGNERPVWMAAEK